MEVQQKTFQNLDLTGKKRNENSTKRAALREWDVESMRAEATEANKQENVFGREIKKMLKFLVAYFLSAVFMYLPFIEITC